MNRYDVIAFLSFQAARPVWLDEEKAAFLEAVRMLRDDSNARQEAIEMEKEP